MQLIADGSEPNYASTLVAYASQMIASFQLAVDRGQLAGMPQISVETRMLFNPQLKSAFLFVPGVMALILMLISAMMTSLTIAREKELGTMELLLVSPLHPLLIVVGKVVPYILLAFTDGLLVLALGVFVFGMPIAGNLHLLLAMSILYVLAALSLGILISTRAQTQQQAMIMWEKETGTIEQINVTPIRKWQFITGKLLPFLFLGLFDLALGLAVGKLLFDIPMVGSLWVVFAFCMVNIFCVLGIGFFISNFADTQQQAMFIAWFFMVIFLLMSGLFTPIESMPTWAQAMTVPNPIAHFVEVMRQVLLKGSSWADIRCNFLTMIGLGLFFNTLAVWTYRKRTG